MAKYYIEDESFLGCSHYGDVTVDSEGYVELTKKEVATLVSLIREKGTTDVKELNLEELNPKIYEKLNDAYYFMAYDAAEIHWLWEGYYNQYFETDDDKLLAYCKEHCGFKFEYNEEDYMEDGVLDEDAIHDGEIEAMYEWIDDYVHTLSDAELRDFFCFHMNDGLDLDIPDVDYTVRIPEEIIRLAEKKD